jgi:hypothetical protein
MIPLVPISLLSGRRRSLISLVPTPVPWFSSYWFSCWWCISGTLFHLCSVSSVGHPYFLLWYRYHQQNNWHKSDKIHHHTFYNIILESNFGETNTRLPNQRFPLGFSYSAGFPPPPVYCTWEINPKFWKIIFILEFISQFKSSNLSHCSNLHKNQEIWVAQWSAK